MRARRARHASIKPEYPREILSSRRLKPSALVPATSHLLNIMSVSTIRMLAGFGQPYMRGPSPPSARLKLSFLATVSTLQARRLKLEASVEIEKRDPSLRSKSAQVFQSDEAQVCASNQRPGRFSAPPPGFSVNRGSICACSIV